MSFSLLQQVVLLEGQGPVSVKLTLGEIISAGKVTNPYQIYVLAWLSEFFKNGLDAASLHLEMPVTLGSNATSSAVMNGLKSMAPEDQVHLAQYLSDCIDAGESIFADRQKDVLDWTRFVLQKQK